MKKRVLFIASCAMFAMSTFCQAQNTFLKPDQVANSLELLPPPPQPGSAQFNYDEAQYKWGKMQRITPRGKQAAEDANLGGVGLSNAFSDAFGIKISKEETPEIYTLISRMQEDAGDLSTRSAKNYYMRMRPFMLFGEQSLTPGAEKWLATNGSYPTLPAFFNFANSFLALANCVQKPSSACRRATSPLATTRPASTSL